MAMRSLPDSSRNSEQTSTTHIFGHPFDLSRSLPPSQNSLGPRTGTLTLHVIALLGRDELLPRRDMNRDWLYCVGEEKGRNENKLDSNSFAFVFSGFATK